MLEHKSYHAIIFSWNISLLMFLLCFFHLSQVSTPPKPAAKQPKVKTPNSEEGVPPADGDGNEGISCLYYCSCIIIVN